MKLIPVDSARCQAEIKEGSFMTLGPRVMQRCDNAPEWLAIEIRDVGLYGVMALCTACKQVCEKQLPPIKFWQLKPSKDNVTRGATE